MSTAQTTWKRVAATIRTADRLRAGGRIVAVWVVLSFANQFTDGMAHRVGIEIVGFFWVVLSLTGSAAIGAFAGRCLSWIMTVAGTTGLMAAIHISTFPHGLAVGVVPSPTLLPDRRDWYLLGIVWFVLTVVASTACLIAGVRRVRRFERTAAYRCQICGYLLHGLPEPRCPECGTPFTPPPTTAATITAPRPQSDAAI